MADFSNPESSDIWDYKPWWCQSWSILLTGIILISGCWLITKTFWLTILLSFLVIVWWGYFLIIYPRIFKQYIENQRDISKNPIVS